MFNCVHDHLIRLGAGVQKAMSHTGINVDVSLKLICYRSPQSFDKDYDISHINLSQNKEEKEIDEAAPGRTALCEAILSIPQTSRLREFYEK